MYIFKELCKSAKIIIVESKHVSLYLKSVRNKVLLIVHSYYVFLVRHSYYMGTIVPYNIILAGLHSIDALIYFPVDTY